MVYFYPPYASVACSEIGKCLCGYFCNIFVSSLGPHWGMSGVEFRHHLESFSARPPLVVHAEELMLLNCGVGEDS